ncbi:hypothetical protein OG21DRAFT_1497254 [Imleria badia]|nr:hypothetical protein OG21DRAFT_1497254 [Imleria badia]
MSSGQSSLSAYLDREREKHSPSKEMLQRYASRCPMTQLPDRYRVTVANPDPPLVHFAIPVHIVDLYKYADKHDLIEYIPRFPQVLSPVSALVATDRLSQEVEYELEFSWPFEHTADCGVILSLYDNYTIEEKMLIDEDQEDVIQMVQEELGLDRSVLPKWYFDWDDSGYSDDETD